MSARESIAAERYTAFRGYDRSSPAGTPHSVPSSSTPTMPAPQVFTPAGVMHVRSTAALSMLRMAAVLFCRKRAAPLILVIRWSVLESAALPRELVGS